jgi:hypothetical protein
LIHIDISVFQIKTGMPETILDPAPPSDPPNRDKMEGSTEYLAPAPPLIPVHSTTAEDCKDPSAEDSKIPAEIEQVEDSLPDCISSTTSDNISAADSAVIKNRSDEEKLTLIDCEVHTGTSDTSNVVIPSSGLVTLISSLEQQESNPVLQAYNSEVFETQPCASSLPSEQINRPSSSPQLLLLSSFPSPEPEKRVATAANPRPRSSHFLAESPTPLSSHHNQLTSTPRSRISSVPPCSGQHRTLPSAAAQGAEYSTPVPGSFLRQTLGSAGTESPVPPPTGPGDGAPLSLPLGLLQTSGSKSYDYLLKVGITGTYLMPFASR